MAYKKFVRRSIIRLAEPPFHTQECVRKEKPYLILWAGIDTSRPAANISDSSSRPRVAPSTISLESYPILSDSNHDAYSTSSLNDVSLLPWPAGGSHSLRRPVPYRRDYFRCGPRVLSHAGSPRLLRDPIRPAAHRLAQVPVSRASQAEGRRVDRRDFVRVLLLPVACRHRWRRRSEPDNGRVGKLPDSECVGVGRALRTPKACPGMDARGHIY